MAINLTQSVCERIPGCRYESAMQTVTLLGTNSQELDEKQTEWRSSLYAPSGQGFYIWQSDELLSAESDVMARYIAYKPYYGEEV